MRVAWDVTCVKNFAQFFIARCTTSTEPPPTPAYNGKGLHGVLFCLNEKHEYCQRPVELVLDDETYQLHVRLCFVSSCQNF
jgi:hypothetical protein